MENNKYLPSVIIISLSLIFSTWLMLKTGIYIKNTGGVESNGKISNTISVSGDGKVYSKPDMVQLSVAFQETASTSKEALAKVNQKIDATMKLLKNNNIPESDITTNNLSVYTEYDYSASSRRVIGQKASQSLEIKIKKIDDKATKATKIIDELSSIDNLQLNGIYFDIEDKTELFSKARELAFNKAEQKAKELAKLAKVKLAKPISISDTNYDVSPIRATTNFAIGSAMDAKSAGSGAQISTGEMDISADLSILWGIE